MEARDRPPLALGLITPQVTADHHTQLARLEGLANRPLTPAEESRPGRQLPHCRCREARAARRRCRAMAAASRTPFIRGIVKSAMTRSYLSDVVFDPRQCLFRLADRRGIESPRVQQLTHEPGHGRFVVDDEHASAQLGTDGERTLGLEIALRRWRRARQWRAIRCETRRPGRDRCRRPRGHRARARRRARPPGPCRLPLPTALVE